MMKWLIIVCSALMLSVIAHSQTNCAGVITRETYTSAWLGQQMVYTVYTPPNYSVTQTLPTLYLMHGSNDDDGHWVRLGLTTVLDELICAGEIPSLIAVLPFGNVIANRNRFDNVSWANVFMTELLPDAQAKYAINPTRGAIGGISRGGFWAYQIGLRFPEQFQAIGGHSAFFDLYHAEPADNPLDLIRSAPNIEPVRFWLDRGANDYAQEGLDIMGGRMAERGLDYSYTIHPQGEHNNAYWSQHITDYVRWYAQTWQSITPTPAPVSAFATNTPLAPVTSFATATPSSPTQAPVVVQEGINTLFVPVVAFPSLLTTLTSVDIQAIARGDNDTRLVVDDTTASALQQAGIMLNPAIQRVPDNQLEGVLWSSREQFTVLPIDRLNPRLRILWLDDRPVLDQLSTYPLALTTNQPNFDATKLTRITLSGVTALARNTLESLDRNGLEWAVSGISDYVQASDFFHVSNEVSFAEGCPRLNADVLGGATSFCSKREHMDLLDLLDVDIVELSGNHNRDYNEQAYQQTLSWYRANEMLTVGGGANLAEAQQPLILEHGDNRIGWVSCNFVGPYYALASDDPQALGGIRGGAAPCDWNWLESTLSQLRLEVDLLIVSVQQQEVEDYRPLPIQQIEFRRLVDLGADVVIGTAAHKPQTFEFYGNGFIHYGLGNLYFDQPFWGNMRFFMNTLYLYNGQLRTVELFTGIIEDNARPRLMTAEERVNFLFFMMREQNGF